MRSSDKTLISILTILVSVISYSLAQPDGDSWAKISKSGTGEVSIVYYEQAGLIEKNKTGQLQGLIVEILNQFVAFIKTNYNYLVTLKYTQEEDAVKFFQVIDFKPNVLGVGNISITDERKLKYKFTPPYIPNVLQLITNMKTPTISTMKDLAGLNGYNGYVVAPSSTERVIERILKAYLPLSHITSKETDLLVFDAIVKDPKSFSIFDFTELLTAKRRNILIKAHPVPLEKTEDFGFIMSKKSDWDIVWNKFLTEDYKSSAEFRKNVVKYLGPLYLQRLKKN